MMEVAGETGSLTQVSRQGLWLLGPTPLQFWLTVGPEGSWGGSWAPHTWHRELPMRVDIAKRQIGRAHV